MLRLCRFLSGLSAAPSFFSQELKSPGDYRLYLLADNSPSSLAKIEHRIKGENAVLLYPDPADKGHSESRKYKACFIQEGSLREHPNSKPDAKLVEEVSMGNRIIRASGALPCDITTQQNAGNLIKAALARAGIRLAPIFKPSQALFKAHLAPKMDTKSLSAFAQTSLYASKRGQDVLDQRGVEKLFTHIRNGEPNEVKKILDANPRLALVRWNTRDEKEQVITNKAGQRISVQGKTGYQFALSEEDTEIAAMFKAAIVRVADEKEANVQYHEQFPEGWEEAEKAKWAKVFAKADALTQAIREAKAGDIVSSGGPEYKLTIREGSAVAEALAQYRSSLDEILNEIVTTGRHFNPNLVQRLFQIYDDHAADYFGDDVFDPRAMLFWRQAIGYAERLFPANYVQAACDGFANTVDKLRNGTTQGRSFKFELFDPDRRWPWWVPVEFYPLSISRLGFDFAIYCRVGGAGGASPWGGVEWSTTFETYVYLKQVYRLLIHHLKYASNIHNLPFKAMTAGSDFKSIFKLV